MGPYLELLKTISERGVQKSDRTGTGTLCIFGSQMRFDLAQGFPLCTTKKIHLKSVIHELLWFLRGDTNIQYLHDHNVTIWDEWADENGDLGPIYGFQWRAWPTCDGESIDQISRVIDQIRQQPDSRRLLVSSWNVGDLDKMALLPCHVVFQFNVVGNKLSCMLTQRSVDVFLGLPFNIASYALLTHMVAQQCGLEPGEFIWSGGDCHLYLNHLEQAATQLSRTPLSPPKLVIRRRAASIFDYQYTDFEFDNYQYHPAIKAPIAV